MTTTMEASPAGQRKRKAGGGRKRKLDTIASLGEHIEAQLNVEPVGSRSAFQWTFKSTTSFEKESRLQDFDVSRRIWADYFTQHGFRMTHNRNLPAQISAADVDAQFRIISRSIRSQWERGEDVLFLEGAKVRLVDVLRERGCFSGQTGIAPLKDYSFTEKVFRNCPQKYVRLDDETETITFQTPYGEICSQRELSEKELEANRKRKREKTFLPLREMITDRNTAMFTAIALRHWLRASKPAPSKRVVLVTHGATPDAIYPRNWERALNWMRKDTGVPITVHRIPPATWRYAGVMRKLFSFTAQDRPEKAKDGYTITAWILPFDDFPRSEIEEIPAVFDKVTKLMLEGTPIQQHAPYGCWNYSFEAGEKGDA